MRAVGHLRVEDVLRVPHARGVVLVFPGDPEDGLFVALGLRDALEHEASMRTDFAARMSIHLETGAHRGRRRAGGGAHGGRAARLGRDAGADHLQPFLLRGRVLAERGAQGAAPSARAAAHGRGQGARRLRARLARLARGGGHLANRPHAGRRGRRGRPPPVLQPIPLVTPIDAPPPAPPPAMAAPVVVTGGWVAGALEELGAVLARSIGPLAHTLVRRAARATEDPRALVAELAESIRERRRPTQVRGLRPHVDPPLPRGGGAPMTPRPPYTPAARTPRTLPTPPAPPTRRACRIPRAHPSLPSRSMRPHGWRGASAGASPPSSARCWRPRWFRTSDRWPG